MIFKFLAFVLVIFFIYIIFFKKNREDKIKDKKYDEITDTLVECPTCNVFVSKDDAILSNGQYYCSSECLK